MRTVLRCRRNLFVLLVTLLLLQYIHSNDAISGTIQNESPCQTDTDSEGVYDQSNLYKIKALLQKMSNKINRIKNMTGEFVQHSNNEPPEAGSFRLERPNKLRFIYDNPQGKEIISDGRDLVIIDHTKQTRDLYPTSQTPVTFLLADETELVNNKTISQVEVSSSSITVTFEQSGLFSTNMLKATFDRATGILLQWESLDPKGFATTMVLKNVKTNQHIDNSVFVIDRLFELHN